MADSGQKTEQPTQRRLEKARTDGKFPISREFVNAVQFIAVVACMVWFAKDALYGLRQFTRLALVSAFRGELTLLDISGRMQHQVVPLLLPLLMVGAMVTLLTVATHLGVTRFGIAGSQLAPQFSRLNPMSRLSELPKRNLPSFIQALFLLPIFAYVIYKLASERLDEYLTLPFRSVESGVVMVATSLKDVCWKAAGLFFLFGAIDLFRQLRRYSSELKMSKQEIREELKDVEGNPQMKMRIRRLQRDLLRRQMMKEVPKATAIIVNPTHYAVAIRYQLDSMAAPLVVAKGKNYLAARIREKAREHQIPIIENPPLAQALYKSVDVGQEIPAHLYRAVAEILAYVFKLMNGRFPG